MMMPFIRRGINDLMPFIRRGINDPDQKGLMI